MNPEFSRALEKIPAQLRERAGARFTVILNGSKKPEGKDWGGPNGANYGVDDPQLAGYLSQGHNYGVLTGAGGLVVVDIDDPDALNELGVLSRIPGTFTVKTGRGGYHFYFDCPELDHQIGIYHPTLKDPDNKNEPLHLGEIQSRGQQIVGPGSTHPNGNKYDLINDAPILSISKADVFKLLDGLILTGVEEPRRAEARRRSSGGSSLGDSIPIDHVAWPKDIKERSGAEIRGVHPLHGSDKGEDGRNFSINTAKNSWYCFRHKTGGGPLEWMAVEEGLIRCQDVKSGCLSGDLFKQVLRIAEDRGFALQSTGSREIPEEARYISEEDLAAMKMDTGPQFKLNLPGDHYLTRYIAYGRDVSDAYPDYWVAGGLYQLALIADKKIWIKLRQGPIYPNLYIFIAGRSSLSRKSTVVDISERLLNDARPGTDTSAVPTEFSPEAFIEHLDENPHASWVRDEAAGVLSIMKRDYMRGFKDTLMQLYDCRPIRRKLRTNQRKNSKTEFAVDDPYLNVLWATTDSSFGC